MMPKLLNGSLQVLVAACAVAPAMACRTSFPQPSAAESALRLEDHAFDQSHAAWTAVLRQHVRGDRFDYAASKKDRGALDRYVASLEAVEPDRFAQWTARQRYAFWINVYNAYTVRRVVDAYPVKSIRDLGDEKLSVWDRELIPLGRLVPDLRKARLTLNDVENQILRPTFRDARVHAAINCASVGCPPLRSEAFVAERLDAQLDEQVRAWLRDGSRNSFDPAKRALEISKVFEWFREDFQKNGKSARHWIAGHLPEHAAWLEAEQPPEVRYREYDWALNDVER